MTNDIQSSSSLDRPRPFTSETPPLNLNIPKSEKVITKIEKLQKDLQRIQKIKEVSSRSLTMELNNLHN
jgi:uncharacterized coiled-coil DUF342 family protein